MQLWPPLRNLATIAVSTATSRSASSNTSSGALPPNSKDRRLMVGAEAAISRAPTAVEPVKVIFRTRLEAVTMSPNSAGALTTTLSTPGGIPASSARAAKARAVNGVSLAGLQTIVQPAARAGAILRVSMAIGKFHGVIAAQTPIGSRSTSRLRPGMLGGRISPKMLPAASA
jgi:hypothetical protein